MHHFDNDYVSLRIDSSPGQLPEQTHTPLAFEHVPDDGDAGAAGVAGGVAGVDEGVAGHDG